MFDDWDDYLRQGAEDEEALPEGVDVDADVAAADAYLRLESGRQTAQELERTLGEGGLDPAFELVRPALVEGLAASQKLYDLLGEQLEQGRLDRSSRALLRRGRRILEQSFGLDAVRRVPAPAQAKYARVKAPLLTPLSGGGFKGSPLAVHRFERRLRKTREGGMKPYYVAGQTYTGADAIGRAVQEETTRLRNRISRLRKDYTRLERGRGGPTVEARKRRLLANIDAAEAELKQYEGLFTPAQAEIEKPAPPTRAAEPLEVARRMAAEGKTFADLRAYLVEVGGMTAREATRAARGLLREA